MIITPSDHAALNSLLKKEKYTTDTYGEDPYIHLTQDKIDLRPWLCLDQIEYDEKQEYQTLLHIKHKLTEIKKTY